MIDLLFLICLPFVVFILIALVYRLIHMRLIRLRIQRHVEELGGELLEITPHSPGLGPINSPIDLYYVRQRGIPSYYIVEFKDKMGYKRTRMCKTTLISGFFWVDDQTPRR